MVLQRWCIFKAALKSFTVLRVACTFGLLGPSAGPAASKTDCSGQQRPLSFSTPQSTSPIVYERLLLLGCIQKHEKTQGPGCAEASKVKRAQGWGEWGGWLRGKTKSRNSSHSPLVFSRFLKRQLLGPCEWSKQPEGKLKRTARGREPHSWGDASPTHRIERHSISVARPGRVCNRLCSAALRLSAVAPRRESLVWVAVTLTIRFWTPTLPRVRLCKGLHQAFIPLVPFSL